MSAMENMAKNILASMVPPQVLAMITSENMEQIIIRAKAFVEQQDRIEKMLIEVLENDRNRSNGRKPVRITRDAPSGGDGSTD